MTWLVTQMYCPGDPLLPLDPIFNCVTGQRARDSMIAAFDLETTVPEFAFGCRWDVALRSRDATPFEQR